MTSRVKGRGDLTSESASSAWRLSSRKSARAGFTLLELLLVLSVLIAVAAVSAPAIFGPLQNYRLRKAGDVVRARWARARNEAMKSGRTLMFQFEPGQAGFQVVPYYSDADYLESNQLFQTGMVANQQPSSATVGTSVVQEQLPENVRFIGLEGIVSIRDLTTTQAAQYQVGTTLNTPSLATGGATALGATAATPVLFYPDGTTSTVQLVLGNEQGQFLLVKLRGLSGVAELSDLMSAEELNQ